MLIKSTRTKVVWSVSTNSFRKLGFAKLAENLIEGPQSAVRATYVGPMPEHLHKLRQELSSQLAQKGVPTPDGWFPYLLSFVGRRAVLCVPGGKTTLANDDKIELHFRVDVLSATFCTPAKEEPGRFEVYVTAADQLRNLSAGSSLALSYGQIELECVSVEDVSQNEKKIVARVLSGGHALTGMDVDSPDICYDLFPLIPEDEEALSNHFNGLADFIVIEGIRSEGELVQLKHRMAPQEDSSKPSRRHPTVAISANVKSPDAPVASRLILKVDSSAILEMLPKLLPHVDGILLSRSELGLTVHPHSLPILQKELIATCNQAAKIVLVASELMYSMRINATPTRAEVSDLANVVADGADAIVLAEEVTEGPYANEVAEVTGETLTKSEVHLEVNWHRVPFEVHNDDDAIAYGTLKIAEHSDAKAIVCLTEGGYTAMRLASLRVPIPTISVCYNRMVMRQLNLIRSVFAAQIEGGVAFDEILNVTKNMLVRHYGLQRGDKIIFVSLTASSIAARNSNLFTLQEID